MSKPYRVVIWGPGFLAGTIVREMAGRPEFEIVGVYCYSQTKDGVDFGDVLGIGPLGVKATRDKQEILALKADCALVCIKDSDDYSQVDDDVVSLLEAGVNVISPTTYMYPPMRGTAHRDRMLAACLKGGASLHGAGENPSMMCERIALTLTGFCTTVDHIGVHELADLVSLPNRDMLQAAGIGKPPADAADATGPVIEKWRLLFRDVIGFMGNMLFDAEPGDIRVESTASCDTAKDDIRIDNELLIGKGTAACVRHEHRGYISDRHFITMGLYWYFGAEYCPFPGVEAAQHHIIEVAGKPISLRMAMDESVTLRKDAADRPGDPMLPGYYMGAVAVIQSIAVVCAAEPGFVHQAALTHYKDDFRKLAQRGKFLQPA